MAITKNTKKAIRVSARKRVYNIRTKSTLHGALKTVKATIAAGTIKESPALIATAYKAIDKAAKRGIIKKNTANRKKSRLMKQIARVAK